MILCNFHNSIFQTLNCFGGVLHREGLQHTVDNYYDIPALSWITIIKSTVQMMANSIDVELGEE